MRSMMSLMVSRSRIQCRNGVKAPRSMASAPVAIRWLAMRFSSLAITRQYSARGGTSMPISFSTASAQPWLVNMAPR